MKQRTVFSLGLICFISLLIFILLPPVTQAQPQPEHHSVTQKSTRFSERDSSLLVATGAYTVYLPIIHAPPPFNPKKGFGAKGSPACVDLTTLRSSWYFNWGVGPDPTCGEQDQAHFVPMIYNGQAMQQLSLAITNAQASGWLIGFGEPNLSWHSDISPAQGAIYWKQIEEAADMAGVKLVSPVPNQWNPGQNGQKYGHQWTWAMVTEYKARYGQTPRFDALGWNIYKGSDDQIKSFLKARRSEALDRNYNVPFWLLEYGGECASDSVSKIRQTMKDTTPWLDATPWIGRYAWFANRLTKNSDTSGVDYTNCTLIEPKTGQITSLGTTYQKY